ncbi:MAG TPA: sensor histidine kinase [Streptosporangiaceae bacterium]|nr:sensor histidine kinase [Streptosporangiaceae bacterium]
MPEDVPLAERGESLNTEGGPHAWQRGLPWWEAYFGIVLAGTLVVVAVTGATAVAGAAACGCLAAAGVAYVLAGRAALMNRLTTWQENAYVICLVALIAVAQSQVPQSSWVLFAAAPLCFMTVPVWRALAALAALEVIPVANALEAQRSLETITAVCAAVLVGVGGSFLLGTWIQRIIRESTERAELIRQLEAAQAKVSRLGQEAGILTERQRLAGEIHDTLAQGLTSIVMLLQAADAAMDDDPAQARRHLELATESAREGLAEARAMVTALTPADLAEDTLPGALQRVTARIGGELGIGARFEVAGHVRPLPAAAEVVLLRAAQEALANVRKHAQAASVTVTLRYADQAVQLEVTDDGAGFDQARVNGGYGLRGMRGRIVQVGGSLELRAQPGAGTSLTVEVPG